MSVVSATSQSAAAGVSLSVPAFNTEQASADLIARMEQVPTSRWFVVARIVMGSATFFDAFNALSIAFVLPILAPLWHITPPEIGILIGASYVGQIIGALAFSWGAERYGRIPCAAAATAIYAVMSLACAAAWSFSILLAFRFIQGIGVGGEMPVAATYISELSRARGRGRFFLFYEMIFPIGLMVTGQVGAWLVPLMGWQIMFLIGGIPGLVIAVMLLRLPESPRWLIGKGRLAAAEAVVRRLEAASDKFGTTDMALPAAALPAQIEVSPRSRGKWSELLSPAYRARTLIAWVLWASAFLVANGLNNWMPTLYTTVYHLALPQALRAASIDQRRPGLSGVDLRARDRSHRPQILDDGRLRPWRGDTRHIGARRRAGRLVVHCSQHNQLRADRVDCGCGLSLHAGDLSDADARGRNGGRDLLASGGFRDRSDPDRIYAG